MSAMADESLLDLNVPLYEYTVRGECLYWGKMKYLETGDRWAKRNAHILLPDSRYGHYIAGCMMIDGIKLEPVFLHKGQSLDCSSWDLTAAGVSFYSPLDESWLDWDHYNAVVAMREKQFEVMSHFLKHQSPTNLVEP
ncbi:hypothetical protein CH29_gp90 [Achromobacter phage JWAlpha]|uniref:Uncharacterized protein n=1 Tax=Achromobacter phage JWAlpha TaxID=1416009 RepID=V9VHR5_9CAUD|nr:hypothetical protein CH29_gp90 [Achromobacter phage JWAlpha]AHC94043.1 hypothetical protein JJJB_0090 [Achromobacter phage JWAlpha]